MASPDDISERVTELARTLLAHEDLQQSLTKVANLAVAVVPHCEAASITLYEDGRYTTRSSTGEVAERVDKHQYDTGEGPCLDAVREGRVILVQDLGAAHKTWPRFVPNAVKEKMASTCSLPLTVGEATVGGLNMYSWHEPFDDGDAAAAGVLTSQAAVTLANAQAYDQARHLVCHLEEALKSRDVIGQAKGIIMERERCTADQAFDILRTISQTRNIKLREVAEMVAMTGSWPQPVDN